MSLTGQVVGFEGGKDSSMTVYAFLRPGNDFDRKSFANLYKIETKTFLNWVCPGAQGPTTCLSRSPRINLDPVTNNLSVEGRQDSITPIRVQKYEPIPWNSVTESNRPKPGESLVRVNSFTYLSTAFPTSGVFRTDEIENALMFELPRSKYIFVTSGAYGATIPGNEYKVVNIPQNPHISIFKDSVPGYYPLKVATAYYPVQDNLGGGGGSAGKDVTSSLSQYWWVILLVILVIIVLIFLVINRKKRDPYTDVD